MKLEVGNKYKDSQERVIKIISDVASLPFCYIGEVLFTGELLRYSLDGVAYGPNDINLVEELGAAQKPKRTISRIIVGSQGNLFALSSDGRLYGLRGFDGAGLPEWLPYTDLPQDG